MGVPRLFHTADETAQSEAQTWGSMVNALPTKLSLPRFCYDVNGMMILRAYSSPYNRWLIAGCVFHCSVSIRRTDWVSVCRYSARWSSGRNSFLSIS